VKIHNYYFKCITELKQAEFQMTVTDARLKLRNIITDLEPKACLLFQATMYKLSNRFSGYTFDHKIITNM